MSEDLIVRHCSPTLAGLKTANLFAAEYTSEEALRNDLRALNRVLVPKGLRALPLRRENGRALIYLYRPKRLAQDLKRTGCGAAGAHRLSLRLSGALHSGACTSVEGAIRLPA